MSAREIGLPALSLGSLDSAQLPVATPARRLSLRSNFTWAVAGNATYALCQWGMIVALAKFGNSFMIGQFSLGLAIATPVLMLSNLDLRAVQATDARRQYRFSEYLRLRLAMTTAAVAVICAIVWFSRYDPRTAAVILAVALAKAVETVSDIHYGLFQLNDRLDQTGRSMMLRGVLSVAALTAGLHFLHSAFWGCICMLIAWLAVLLLFDFRRGRSLLEDTEAPAAVHPAGGLRQSRLLSLALPLGLVTTIASINLHMPRYFIHARMGESQLGMFSAMAYATVSLTLVGDSLGNSAIPRLSRHYASGELAEFRSLLLILLGIGCAIGLSGLAVAWGFGARFLAAFYNSGYAIHAHVFALLMAAAAIHFAASMLTSGITAARRFRIQIPLYAAVAASTALGCAHWVPTMGLAGAALGVLCGAATRLLLAAIILGRLVLAAPEPASETA
jgi:O-antigen/teichoic acid export membrane protein